MTRPMQHLYMRWCLLLWLGLLVMVHPAQAQLDIPNHVWEIYLERDVDATGLDRLVFLDILTGETVTVDAYGERYTPVSNGVIFYDYVANQVKLANSDGTVNDHPFMQLADGARQIDWVVASDGRNIAWTLTYGQETNITTRTLVATVDGANLREALFDGPRSGLRALPVAFTVDSRALIMDTHPDGLGRFTPYTQYAGLFEVDLETGAVNTLPGEPACFCGAGIRAGRFLRLVLNRDLTGYDVRVYDLQGERDFTIPALPLRNYTQAGDVLIAPDGQFAVYALSQIEDFGTPQQSVETVFMLVNLLTLEQSPLTSPITDYVHPVRWSENNSAIIFTSPQRNGTWKIDLATGEFNRVARLSYVGLLAPEPSSPVR
jgi:hypothetical protein